MINFPKINTSQLILILQKYNIDIQDWNHEKGHKTVEQLAQELNNGESTLELIDDNLMRLVKVSSIDVKFKLGDQYFQLIEDKQILFSGAIKTRNLNAITEKVKINEEFLAGAYRGLAEEIGLNINSGLKFIQETTFQESSPNYPNLISYYQVFNYEVILGEQELGLIRFSEYVPEEQRISLFTLKYLDSLTFKNHNK